MTTTFKAHSGSRVRLNKPFHSCYLSGPCSPPTMPEPCLVVVVHSHLPTVMRTTNTHHRENIGNNTHRLRVTEDTTADLVQIVTTPRIQPLKNH